MKFCLTKINFIIMGVAALIIVVGFVLMWGAPSTPEAFNPDVFSTRRVVVAPNICFFGYLLMVVGILVKGPRRRAELADERNNTAA